MNAIDNFITKTYKGNQKEATRAFQEDSFRMSQKGYYPTSQTWAPGSYGCGAFLLALLLCAILIGILVFIYMLIVKPPGTLTVTYELRLPSDPSKKQISNEEKICPACAETIKLKARKCRYCGEQFDEKETEKLITKAKTRILCADGNCTGALGLDGICRTCKKSPEEVSVEESQYVPTNKVISKKKLNRYWYLVFLLLALWGVMFLFFGKDSPFKPNKSVSSLTKNKQATIAQDKIIISPTKTKKRLVTTQEQTIAAPAKTEKQPAVDEKKALKTDNYFGNYTNPIIKKESGTIVLKVWQPYIDYMRTLPDMYQVLLHEPFQLRVEYDEIWVDENDEPFTEQEKKEYKGQLDLSTLYWKNDKIQAYKLEKYYEGNPRTHSPVNAHQITSIHDRVSILKKLKE